MAGRPSPARPRRGCTAISCARATGPPIDGWPIEQRSKSDLGLASRTLRLPAVQVADYIAAHRPFNHPPELAPTPPLMDIRKLQRAIVDGLEDVKAQDIVV